MSGILTYTATFILGLLHAFEPGHGKSILAAFSLRQANLRIFASLIFSLFVSHFLILGLFAFVLQSISSTELVEDYSEYLQLMAPLLVITFGSYLFCNALKHHKTETDCSCGHQHASGRISNTRTASITGFIAGLMPCPTATAPLIISGMHDAFSDTLMHILVYVTGMTLALFIFTGMLLLIKSFVQERIKLFESRLNFNLISASIMMGIGFIYLLVNMLSSEAHLHF